MYTQPVYPFNQSVTTRQRTGFQTVKGQKTTSRDIQIRDFYPLACAFAGVHNKRIDLRPVLVLPMIPKVQKEPTFSSFSL